MNRKILKSKGAKDLGYTLMANFLMLLSGIASTFIIAKIWTTDVTAWYAYSKVFTLYVGYVGFFHFGFNDGIMVNYGNYDYETLPRRKFRSYFRFLLCLQVAIAMVLAIVSFAITKDPVRLIIDLFICANVVIMNLTCYFEFISQIVRKFKLYSYNTMLNKGFYIASILALYLLKNKLTDLKKLCLFMGFQTFIGLIVLIIYIIRFKEITFGQGEVKEEIRNDIKSNMKLGFFIMLGNFVSIIIIGVDRIVIDNLQRAGIMFTQGDMSMYSFAVSLLNMVYILLNGIKSLAYPYLARIEKKNLAKNYATLKDIIFVVFGYCLCAYFTFYLIIIYWFPVFKDALSVTAIIFPTILISATINIVTCNYYKILKLKKEYTKNSIIGVVVSLVTIAIAVTVFKTKEAIAVSSLTAFYIWGIYGDEYFGKKLGISTRKHYIAQIIVIALFLFTASMKTWYLGMILYIVGFTIVSFLFFGETFKSLVKKFIK